MYQFKLDVLRFSDLLSKYTSISKSKIDKFLTENTINNIFDHPTALDVTKAQLNKISELKELSGLYDALKESYSSQYTLRSSDSSKNYFKAIFFDKKDKERLICAFLDNANNVIATKVQNVGTVDQSAVYPREIAKDALLYDAKGVIVAHNHPGGSLNPSSADVDVTQKIMNALSAVNIKLLDHIIVANDHVYSFSENGMLVGQSMGLSTVFENVKQQYETSWPAISCISENTAHAIHDLNTKCGKDLSIDEIKSMYKTVGSNLEVSGVNNSSIDFTMLQSIVDGLKQANLRYMNQQASSNKAAVNENEL